MTIMKLFESVEIRGLVSIRNNRNASQTFYCNSKYPLDDIDIMYWDKEVKNIIANNNKFIIITKD